MKIKQNRPTITRCDDWSVLFWFSFVSVSFQLCGQFNIEWMSASVAPCTRHNTLANSKAEYRASDALVTYWRYRNSCLILISKRFCKLAQRVQHICDWVDGCD